MESKYLATAQPCSRCGSSDAKTYYKDGGSKCFSCGAAPNIDPFPGDNVTAFTPPKQQKQGKVSMSEVKTFGTADVSSRDIPKWVADMFGVKQAVNMATGEPDEWYFPYTKDGEVVGYKVRKVADKQFHSAGIVNATVDPFGWSRVSEGGKLLIVVEGEFDAMAATALLKEKGKNYKVVSVANGAQSAEAFVKGNIQKLEKFETIMFNFDMDEPGQDAQKACMQLLSPGKAKGMTLPKGFKDANDILSNGKAYQYLEAVQTAKEYRPDGIVMGEDTWELYAERPPTHSYPFPDTWAETNRMTYGIRLSELDTFTSGTSAGKTQLMREIVYHYLKTTDLKIGVLSLEEPVTDTIESYLELELNKRISLPDVDATKEERRGAWEATFGTERIALYDAWGGEESRVMSMVRYMSRGLGCQLVIIDHLHMLLDGKDSEKEQIERMMLTLKRLTQELGIWIGLIAHLKKSSGGTTFEEGAIASLDDLKGSSSIKQLSNGVYVLSRDQQAEDVLTRNTTQVTVKKCRFTGRTGLADRLLFDDDTGRMNVLKPDDVPF